MLHSTVGWQKKNDVSLITLQSKSQCSLEVKYIIFRSASDGVKIVTPALGISTYRGSAKQKRKENSVVCWFKD